MGNNAQQKIFDISMINDYKILKKQLQDSNMALEEMAKTIAEISNEFSDSIFNVALDDLSFILESINYLHVSCENTTGVRSSFFPSTTFYRQIISAIKLVYLKIDFIFKNNKSIGCKEKDKIEKIIVDELKWRNQLEHGIDPFYDGDYFKIIKTLTVEKMVLIINAFLNYIKIFLVTTKTLNKVDAKKIPAITFHLLDNMKIMNIITRLHEPMNNIFIKTTQMSHMSMELGEKADIEFRNVIDISLKYIELAKLINYTYKDLKSSCFSRLYPTKMYYEFSYFCRVSITIYYQLCDKISTYLNNKYLLGLDEKKCYFKSALSEIDKKGLSNDTIITKCRTLRVSEEYNVLNSIRQGMVHDFSLVQYKEYSTQISSLIVILLNYISCIVENIINDYFEKNNINVTQEAQREAYQKTSYKVFE